MAVVASFSAAGGILSVFGDALDNNVTVSRDASGKLLVNGGAVAILGGSATVANTALVQIFGQGGADTITLSETNGTVPAGRGFGGAGKDRITSGWGRDQLFGQSGNDVLFGRNGGDFLFGGSENDSLTGGDGEDSVFGESGDDRLIWNSGDDADLFEGGVGVDTAEVNGGSGAEVFTAAANGARVRFDGLGQPAFALDIGTMEHLVLNAGGGNDKFSTLGNLAPLLELTIDGGAGNDTLDGGNGSDVLIGGDGSDVVDGQKDNDVALLGSGNDIFQWDPGDGNDVVEGEAGNDTTRLNGSSSSERFDLSTEGGRLRLTRDIGSLTLDADGVEIVELKALTGADSIVVDDLTGTDVAHVAVNLQSPAGGADAQADTVTAAGTDSGDVVAIVGGLGSMAIFGLPARIQASGMGTGDRFVVHGHGGNDSMSIGGTVLPNVVALDGGDGNDILSGGSAADSLVGGSGGDRLFGGGGGDTLTGGSSNDTFMFGALTDSQLGTGADRILDFTTGDKIDVSAIDAIFGGADDAFVLDATPASFAAGEIRQGLLADTVTLNFNVDADSAAEMSVMLTGRTAPLTAADFVL